MNELRKAAEMALEALEWYCKYGEILRPLETKEALRQALAQPEQEPVAWMTHTNTLHPLFHKTMASALNWQTQPTPLYTAPPKREWVGLTDGEREEATGWSVEHIEAFLKEKNT